MAELISMSYNEIARLVTEKLLCKPIFQRPLDLNQVDNIAKYINNEICNKTFYLGVCVISERNDKIFVLDGQHRIYAISKSMQNNKLKLYNLDEHKLSVFKYNGLTLDDERSIFKTINLGVPCPKYYISDESLIKYNNKVKKLFMKRYKDALSETPKCNVPNINIEKLIVELYERKVITNLYETGEIKTPSDLKQKIIELNDYIGIVLKKSDGKIIYSRHATTQYQITNLQTFIEKVEKNNNPCYLGLIPKLKWINMIGCHRML